MEVVPRGVPHEDWDLLGFALVPLGYLRHALFHRGEYSAVVVEERRWGWLRKVRDRRNGLSREQAPEVAAELAATWRGGAPRR